VTGPLRTDIPAVDGEFETEWEGEWEDELEGEYEDELEAEWEGEFEDEWELEGEYEDESEGEFEFEAEYEQLVAASEGEGFVNPVRRVYADAELMAHLSHAARQTEDEGEAEAFVSALVPLAARLIPRAAAVVRASAPTLIRGVTRVVRDLRRDPVTRRYVDAVPVILQRTAQSLADQSTAGRPLTGGAVLDTLSRMTGRVLSTPHSRASAVRAVRAFDRGSHRRRRPIYTGVRRVPSTNSRQRGVVARRRGNAMAVRRGRRY
jgi:hypothetical protein